MENIHWIIFLGYYSRTKKVISTGSSVAGYNIRFRERTNAGYSMLLTLFLILVLCVASLLFGRDATSLAKTITDPLQELCVAMGAVATMHLDGACVKYGAFLFHPRPENPIPDTRYPNPNPNPKPETRNPNPKP